MFKSIVKVGLVLGLMMSSLSAEELTWGFVPYVTEEDSHCTDYSNTTIKEFGSFKNGKISCKETDESIEYNVVFKGDKFNVDSNNQRMIFSSSMKEALKSAYEADIKAEDYCKVEYNIMYNCDILLKQKPRIKLFWKAVNGSNEYNLNVFKVK